MESITRKLITERENNNRQSAAERQAIKRNAKGWFIRAAEDRTAQQQAMFSYGRKFGADWAYTTGQVKFRGVR